MANLEPALSWSQHRTSEPQHRRTSPVPEWSRLRMAYPMIAMHLPFIPVRAPAAVYVQVLLGPGTPKPPLQGQMMIWSPSFP